MQLQEIIKLPQAELDKLKKELVLRPLESKEELRAWVYLFFDIHFPMGVVYPDSTHGPVDAMWEIYRLMKTGDSATCPQVCMLSSRDSYKTLNAAALEVLCMLHFEIPVAHMAAIKQQSAKAVQYINGFFRKVRPYLEHHGWTKKSDSKTYIDWITPTGNTVWLNIVTATIAGANCIHKDTVVLTESGPKNASEIKQGDILRSFDIWEQRYILTEVIGVSKLQADARELVFEDGSNIVLSHKHKVFTQRGWLNSGTLRVGDRVISEQEKNYTEYIVEQNNPSWNLNSMIYGTLLGDASIQKLPSGSCRYQVFHTKDQLEYLQSIKATFEKNNIKASIIPDRDGYRLYTEAHEKFKEAYKLCYPKNKKTVNRSWISNIDLEAIAFLIMDDGTTHRKHTGKYKENPIDIATLSFSKEENELIIDKIKSLGYDAKIHRFGEYNQIRIPINSSRDISFDTKNYFVNCLKYKLIRSDDIRFAIDTGKPITSNSRSYGFIWEDNVLSNRRAGRDYRKKIKPFLNKKIISIKEVGSQPLVGITIKDEDFNKKSFFANGILVHNSEHVPMLFIDEVDVVQDPRALKEAKMIPSVWGDYFPLTVYLSTRKFAGGLMEKTLDETIKSGGKILRWNIIDVTQRITKEEARVDEPKITRYVTSELPMETLTPEEWEKLPVESKVKYEKVEAYAGIADHPMLPVMRNYLVDRPQEDTGDLYKPLVAVHNNFKQLPPDMGEAQLLCNKPSSSGLVYPRFDSQKNVLSVREAIQKITGENIQMDNFEYLKDYIKNLGVPIIGGADWGMTDMTSFVILAMLPGGEVWHLETVALAGLEIDDIVKYGKELQDEWGVDKWYADQNYPAYLSMLRRKAGWRCPQFKKVVLDGIAGLQSKIVDSNNVRKYFVINTPSNRAVIDAFAVYRWALDGKGDVIEGKPHHGEDGTSDIMDSIRYPAQNLFIKGMKPITASAGGEQKQNVKNSIEANKKMVETLNEKAMKDQIQQLATNDGISVKKKGKIFWG